MRYYSPKSAVRTHEEDRAVGDTNIALSQKLKYHIAHCVFAHPDAVLALFE